MKLQYYVFLVLLFFATTGFGKLASSHFTFFTKGGRPIAEDTTKLNDRAREIFRTKCIDCHSGGANGDPHHMFGLNGFPRPGHEALVRITITAHRTERRRMPPNNAGDLTPEEITILKLWAEANGDRNVPPSLTEAVKREIFNRNNLVRPADLRQRLTRGERPRIWNIGSMGNILGATGIGPLQTVDGIRRLNDLEAQPGFSKTDPLIIYCGCCPLETCPNILPALYILNQRGYTQVKVLNLPNNIDEDWKSIGGPMEPE